MSGLSVVLRGRPAPALRTAVERALADVDAPWEILEIERPYGEALGDGARAAKHPWLLTLETAQAHDPAFIPWLWKARDRADLVIGSRYVRFAFADMPLMRRLGSAAFNALFRRILSLAVRDVSSAFRLYRRDALLEALPEARGYDALLEVLVNLDCAGYRIDEVPVHHHADGQGDSAAVDFASECLSAAGRLWKRRNSVFSADYDHRAFFSMVLPQRMWQRRRYEVVRRMMAGETGRILDLGCGSSMIAMSLPRSVAVDILFKKLRYLKHLALPVLQASLDRLPFANDAFDLLICSQVIEHVPRELIRFDEMHRVIRPGGRMIIGTPDYGTIGWNVTEAIYHKVMPGGYADEHVTHFTLASLTADLEAAGFRVLEHRYVFTGELVMLAEKKA